MAEALLYVALDHNDRKSNVSLAEKLNPIDGKFGYKINLDHYCLWPWYVEEIAKLDKPFFVDLKMSNGSRTMRNIVEDVVSKGARHTNVWASAERLIKPLAELTRNSNTELLGVTITTHFTEDYCRKFFGKSLPDTVRLWSEAALENGCDGIIIPGTTLNAVANLDCPKLVPAIRPLWFQDRKTNDQEQPVTPTEAKEGGATIMVCGSPIYKSPDPVEALQRILEEIKGNPAGKVIRPYV